MAKRACMHAGTGECKRPVTYDADPYTADVHGDETKVWMCAEHRTEAALDI